MIKSTKFFEYGKNFLFYLIHQKHIMVFLLKFLYLSFLITLSKTFKCDLGLVPMIIRSKIIVEL